MPTERTTREWAITMVDEKTNPILRVLARVSNVIVYECRRHEYAIHYLQEQGQVILDEFFDPP